MQLQPRGWPEGTAPEAETLSRCEVGLRRGGCDGPESRQAVVPSVGTQQRQGSIERNNGPETNPERAPSKAQRAPTLRPARSLPFLQQNECSMSSTASTARRPSSARRDQRLASSNSVQAEVVAGHAGYIPSSHTPWLPRSCRMARAALKATSARRGLLALENDVAHVVGSQTLDVGLGHLPVDSAHRASSTTD